MPSAVSSHVAPEAWRRSACRGLWYAARVMTQALNGALPVSLWLFLAMLSSISPVTASADPGLLLELDREHYRVMVRDLRSGEAGPTIPVVLGSPASPTPSGSYPLSWVILRPSWHPAPDAMQAGAQPEAASLTTPMGAAKIPFAENGSVALHGGGDPRLMGKAVSAGCVRAGDGDLLRVIAWLDQRDALGAPRSRDDHEIHRPFKRPARMLVR